jgi:2-succinyl-5-enolpyruvyl-6-hydroxy-3-cyclohexene-1-carboxylate synthase
MTNRYQPIYDIAALCAQRGVHNAVLCPGSRCAPLTIAFTRHPGITARTFSDERSAGFIGLGVAQQSKMPVALICTSGSAAYNFAPAVSEAFFSQTPLIIFTADRPAEWIAQHDGQTIHQAEIFGKHVKRSYTLPQDYDHPDSVWAINRIVNEAINVSLQEPAGPVHINAPFREPLYPKSGDNFSFSENIRTTGTMLSFPELSPLHKTFISENLPRYKRILAVAGQLDHDPEMLLSLRELRRVRPIPVVGDIISNLHSLEDVIRYADAFLGQASEEVKKTLRPDLLITFGKSVISKNVKLFLRRNKAVEHWHIQTDNVVADPFQSVTNVINASPSAVLNFIASLPVEESFESQKQDNYFRLWQVEERRVSRTLQHFFPQQELGELELVHEVMSKLPDNCNLHLANSMSVRYANFIGLKPLQSGVRVYANRGTSGIDGCTSTAVGHCFDSATPNVLITGDVAFFYDRNAFWHNYSLPNFRVVLLNNHGGIIFGIIDGPASLPESGEFFVTKQKLNASRLCDEFGFDHLSLDNRRKLKNLIKDLFEFDGRTRILELESEIALNRKIFEAFKSKIKNSYES